MATTNNNCYNNINATEQIKKQQQIRKLYVLHVMNRVFKQKNQNRERNNQNRNNQKQTDDTNQLKNSNLNDTRNRVR